MADEEVVLLETSRFRVVEAPEPRRDGSLGKRAVIRHPGAVTIVPMVDADHVCLIRNRRTAVGRTLIELPAGTLNPGEQPMETARRELAEETGYRASRFALLYEFLMSPGIIDERMFLYLAEELEPGPPALESDEQIENLITPWDDAMQMCGDGSIQDAKTLVGLLHYDRLRNVPS